MRSCSLLPGIEPWFSPSASRTKWMSRRLPRRPAFLSARVIDAFLELDVVLVLVLPVLGELASHLLERGRDPRLHDIPSNLAGPLVDQLLTCLSPVVVVEQVPVHVPELEHLDRSVLGHRAVAGLGGLQPAAQGRLSVEGKVAGEAPEQDGRPEAERRLALVDRLRALGLHDRLSG